jgi:hypothetical protein
MAKIAASAVASVSGIRAPARTREPTPRLLSVPLSVDPDGVRHPRSQIRADRAGVSRKDVLTSDFVALLGCLISVRSVVQLYPGPLRNEKPRTNFRCGACYCRKSLSQKLSQRNAVHVAPVEGRASPRAPARAVGDTIRTPPGLDHVALNNGLTLEETDGVVPGAEWFTGGGAAGRRGGDGSPVTLSWVGPRGREGEGAAQRPVHCHLEAGRSGKRVPVGRKHPVSAERDDRRVHRDGKRERQSVAALLGPSFVRGRGR